ncbi:hypothetical protein ZHAS_00001410 [Anopheles sinensis]|uniref:Uncharacterized protein n=1 Tax=Anopheles sinensis TaxID=74873 RepID=A0A084VBA1_ANOSI|nr:hypothetical protein ZHAS_00001410 [Anopheles sinensis]
MARNGVARERTEAKTTWTPSVDRGTAGSGGKRNKEPANVGRYVGQHASRSDRWTSEFGRRARSSVKQRQ